jgi:uncharacterized RDD family membrane protein YckC
MVEGSCPRCGSRIGQKEKGSHPDETKDTSQHPIQFEMMIPAEKPKAQKQVDWKGELKKKLEQRTGKKKDSIDEFQEEQEPKPEPKIKLKPEAELDPEKEPAEHPPTLFKYKLDRALRDSTSKSRKGSVSKSSKDQPVFEKPLIRRKPIRPVPQPPGQKTLHLKPDVPIARRGEDRISDAVEEGAPRVSREILFSRFLSGIVDLVLPLLTGFAFTIVASFLIGFDLLSPSSIQWIGLFSLSFFLFNSLFFFMTSGQTPGMVVTDLRLVSEKTNQEVSPTDILLRVLVFLPSALTVIGLGWAIFDPMCRCLHDLVSRTRIEPSS